MIENPDYKGTWAPKKIPNPNFKADEHASDLEPIGGLGFELWTMQEDILFDNIYVGHSVDEAEAIGNATFVPKLALEAEEEKLSGPQKETAPWDTDEGVLSSVDMFLADPVSFVLERVLGFFEVFSQDPVSAIREDPVVAAASFGLLLITSATAFGLLNVIIFLLFGKKKQSAAPAKKTKKTGDGPSKLTKADVVEAEAEAEQAAETVVASGVDDGSAELKKRKA
jgi:calnexin